MRRLAGSVAAAAAVLVATLLPWSSTAAAGRSGWQTASLALALDEAVHRPVLTVLACVWFSVPLLAAAALAVATRLPRRWAVVALRSVGALLLVVVPAVLVAVHSAGADISLSGPLLALAGAAALVAVPAPIPDRPRTRRSSAATTGVQ